MTAQLAPNARVWSQGREYVEAAEILLDYNRVHPAAVLASLAIEIFIKSFLATRLASGHVTTKRGHELFQLYLLIERDIRAEFLKASSEIDAAINFEAELLKHDGLFTTARYFYEPTAPSSIGSDTVHFARHVCESALRFGMKVSLEAHKGSKP